jgi:tight adherence protein B
VTAVALLAVAAAVLLWTDGREERRRWVRGRAAGAVRPAAAGLPVPALAAGAAAAVTAAVSTLLVAGLAAVLAAVAARAVLAHRRAGRLDDRLRSLIEGLAALGAELRSGRPLTVATEAAVAACGDTAGGRALARAVRAAGSPAPAGPTPPDDVLADALRRISAAVRLSTRTGCSLAAVLGAVEDDLRARRRLRQELRAATAGPAASATVLASLPAVGLAMGSGVGADPWHVLTATGTGQVLLVAGVALELAGLAWTQRLVGRALR